MFESTVALLNEYVAWIERTRPEKFSAPHEAELRERLHQLSYLNSRIEELDREAVAFERTKIVLDEKGTEVGDILEAFMRHAKGVDVMKIYVESFYYFAARVRAFFRHTEKPLPGLEGFDCIGVRDVRNHLIEHPEGSSSRVLTRSFQWNVDVGMTLKGARTPDEPQVFQDEGFRANVAEFKTNLEAAIRRAVKSG